MKNVTTFFTAILLFSVQLAFGQSPIVQDTTIKDTKPQKVYVFVTEKNLIKAIQHAFNQRGYHLKEDNILGQETREAMVRLEKDKGIPSCSLHQLLDVLGIKLVSQ